VSLNVCRNGYYGGASQGGSRRSGNAYGTCPTCGKRVQITARGTLRVHGTQRKEEG
jgi:hypothetical protein